jgi:hypothetical protein
MPSDLQYDLNSREQNSIPLSVRMLKMLMILIQQICSSLVTKPVMQPCTIQLTTPGGTEDTSHGFWIWTIPPPQTAEDAQRWCPRWSLPPPPWGKRSSPGTNPTATLHPPTPPTLIVEGTSSGKAARLPNNGYEDGSPTHVMLISIPRGTAAAGHHRYCHHRPNVITTNPAGCHHHRLQLYGTLPPAAARTGNPLGIG